MKLHDINVVDLLTGVFLFVLSLFTYFYILPNQVEEAMAGPLALSPSLFCEVITVLLIFLNFLLIVFSIFHNAIISNAESTSDGGTGTESASVNQKRVIVTICVSIVYILIIERIGFFTSTAAVMLFLMVYFGHRKPSHIFIILAIVLSFIYVLFVMGLRVILPSGLII